MDATCGQSRPQALTIEPPASAANVRKVQVQEALRLCDTTQHHVCAGQNVGYLSNIPAKNCGGTTHSMALVCLLLLRGVVERPTERRTLL